MRELLALTGRHLRTSARSRTSRVAVAVFVLALIAAVLAGRDAPAPSLLLAVATLALTFVAAGFAVGAGTVLPEDRLAGREEWLATLAPPGWKRRLSVVLAAWVIAAGAGLVGGALAGAVTAFVRADALFRAWEVVPLGESRLLDRAAPLEFALPAAPHGYDELEFEIRPLFRDFGRRDVVQIIWASGQQGGTFDASVRGPLRVPVAAKARALTLSTSTEGVRLRVVEARRLGPARAPVPALAWLGLLLGLCVGAVAPVAVLLSRGTTGQTAAAGAGCLLLLGAVKGGILELAGRLGGEGWRTIVPGILHTFAGIAPDVPLIDLLVEATARRAPPPGTLALALPAVLYTLVLTAAACAPLRRGGSA